MTTFALVTIYLTVGLAAGISAGRYAMRYYPDGGRRQRDDRAAEIEAAIVGLSVMAFWPAAAAVLAMRWLILFGQRDR